MINIFENFGQPGQYQSVKVAEVHKGK